MNKKWMKIIALVVVAVISFKVYDIYTSTFTQEKWDKHVLGREKMLTDMLIKNELSIMNMDEVLNLLGTNKNLHKSDKHLNYLIGAGYVGPRMLFIHFDESGKVKSYYVVED